MSPEEQKIEVDCLNMGFLSIDGYKDPSNAVRFAQAVAPITREAHVYVLQRGLLQRGIRKPHSQVVQERLKKQQEN